jgi:hypothetical protein
LLGLAWLGAARRGFSHRSLGARRTVTRNTPENRYDAPSRHPLALALNNILLAAPMLRQTPCMHLVTRIELTKLHREA